MVDSKLGCCTSRSKVDMTTVSGDEHNFTNSD